MKEGEVILSYKKLQQLTGEGVDHPGEFRILIVEDNAFDAELMLRELHRQTQIKFIYKTVTDKNAYEAALRKFLPDVVYCDFNIEPGFDAVIAIRILKNDYPEIPFVLVTGALNEEVASICMSEGIDDYVLKANMKRLPLSLINAIRIRKIEMQKKEVYEKLVKAESQVRNFAKHLNQVLEDERANLAREIHDELGQQLAGIKMGLFSFKKFNTKENGIEGKVEDLAKNVDTTIQSLRRVATALRPGILDTLGLVPSIEWLTNEFEKRTNIKCRIEINVDKLYFEKDVSTCFFRICQEGLTNISKHAAATKVVVRITHHDHQLQLNLSDNGKGIDNTKLENPFSLGLVGMRERAKMINGQLLILSEKDMGTSIQLKAPVK